MRRAKAGGMIIRTRGKLIPEFGIIIPPGGAENMSEIPYAQLSPDDYSVLYMLMGKKKKVLDTLNSLYESYSLQDHGALKIFEY